MNCFISISALMKWVVYNNIINREQREGINNENGRFNSKEKRWL